MQHATGHVVGDDQVHRTVSDNDDDLTGSEYSIITHRVGFSERTSQFICGLPSVVEFRHGYVVEVMFIIGTVEDMLAERDARRHLKE